MNENDKTLEGATQAFIQLEYWRKLNIILDNKKTNIIISLSKIEVLPSTHMNVYIVGKG